METILVCYEERPVAGRVLERAAQLSQALDARVIVTSVAPVLTASGRSMGAIDPTDSPGRHETELDEAVRRLEGLGVRAAEKVAAIGDPARAIVDIAEERHVDLIVLGAHDGGILSRLFEGGVDSRVVQKAGTDVLVVH